MKKILILACLSLGIPSLIFAGDTPADPAGAATTTVATSELEQLKRMVLDQQRQIDELRRQMAGDRSVTNAVAATPDSITRPSSPLSTHSSVGEVASMAPVVPPIPAPAPVVVPSPIPQGAADSSSPLQFKIGDAYVTPVGFMDFT